MGFASKVQIGATQHSIAASLFGTCDSLANEAAKAVAMGDFDALIPGTTIHVKFAFTNTAANPTLNVNGTGAKPIYRHGVTTPGTSKIGAWAAGAVVSFTLTGSEDDGFGWTMEEPFDLTQMVNFVYPVGSIYMSVNSTSPATLFGGTWERITGKFLLSATDGGSSGASRAAGATGGYADITAARLPSHTHTVGAHAHGLNSHTHTGPSHSHGLNSHTHGLNSHTHTGPSHSHGLNSHTHSIPALSGTAASNGSHTHLLKFLKYAFSSGSGEKPYLVDVGGDYEQTVTVAAGAHTHSVTTTASTTGGSTASTAAAGTGATGAATGNTAAASGNTAAAGTGATGAATGNTANSTAFNSGATGSGSGDNNMPPYLAVYVWKRTA